jgi:hypothetical protein
MGFFNGILTITDLSNFSYIMAIGANFFLVAAQQVYIKISEINI